MTSRKSKVVKKSVYFFSLIKILPFSPSNGLQVKSLTLAVALFLRPTAS